MIALLDPALFVWGKPHEELKEEDETRIAATLSNVLVASRMANASLIPIRGYWDELWREFGAPLRARLRTSRAKRAFDELRKAGGRPGSGASTVFQTAPPSTRVWGFKTMFGQWSPIPDEWVDRMAAAASSAVSTGSDVILLARLVDGRNLRIHRGKQHVNLHEITRWRLYVRLPEAPRHIAIDCIRTSHQVKRHWTIRYDERLPTCKDGVRYPFCIHDHWHLGRVAVCGTKLSAPAWIDRMDRGWVRPNIPEGAGYHWDVYFENPHDVDRIGGNQLNIVEYGAPSSEGTPGDLHHIPTAKQYAVMDRGFQCDSD